MQDTGRFVCSNSPAAIVKVKTDGDLCALGDRRQRVDVQMQHAVLNDVPHLRRKVTQCWARKKKKTLPLGCFPEVQV